MKNIVIVLLTVAGVLILPGCKKAIESLLPPVEDTPETTPMGTAVSDVVSKTIDKNGGSIIAADGNAELIFPAGALDDNTTISIQAITNYAPNGVGHAYRFLPGGIKFSQPVTLKFHYTANDLASTLADLMGIATQDMNGAWYRVNNFTNDAGAKTISAPINHFSDWSLFEALKITPSSASIRVNQTMTLEIEMVNTGNDDDELAPIYKRSSKVTWNTTAGDLTGNDDLNRSYRAPAKVPSQNPVAVSALVSEKFKYHGKTFDKTSLVSNIRVLDGDEVYLLEIKLKESNWFQGILATDSVSMRIKIQDTTVTVYNITNFEWKSDPETLVIGNTTIAWVPDPNEGPINITGATGDIAIDFLGPNTRFLGLYFTHSNTHNPWYHKTIPPNVDEYWGGEAIAGLPAGCSFNLIAGQTTYDNGNNDTETVKLTLQQ